MNTKSHIKRILTLALYLGIFAGFSALSVPVGAAVISINIESQEAGPQTNYNPMYGDRANTFVTGTTTEWNVLWAGDADGFARDATTGVLGTMDGSTTKNDVKFTIVGSAGRVGRLYCKNDAIYCTGTNYTGSNPITEYEFSYTGLIPGYSYDLKFFVNRSYSTVTIGGVARTSSFNSERIDFTGAVADENGVITGFYERNPVQLDKNDRLNFMQIRGVFEPISGTPSGGVEVLPANPLTLSWTNMTPNVGTDVYVDVWYGTSPESLVKIIDANSLNDPNESKNLTSLGVDASGDPQMYYWRVDSYLGGAGNLIDANMVEGPLYSFYATTDSRPQDIVAGYDWITWANEPVDLLGSYTDAGSSAVTVEWSSNDPNAVFEPSLDGGATSFHIAPKVTVDYASGPVTLTFLVNDGHNPPVTDTMTIDVYKDLCAAGVAAGLSVVFPGDINADCVTNIDDFIIMAQSWLLDTQLTESVSK